MPTPAASAIRDARRVLSIEARAISQLVPKIGPVFAQSVELMYACTGRVVVCGLGKSGIIGQKIAATLASTGTPSFFLHASEAIHGDLGMLRNSDVLLAISNSGETDELIRLLPQIKRLGVRLVAMTGKPKSTLATSADFVLDVSVREEACPLGLAPTASTTAVLAMGDALSVALLNRRKFKPEDFARLHPGGELGKRLIRVRDIMHTGKAIPKISAESGIEQAIKEMTGKRFGCVGVVGAQNRLAGIFTDGDLRRLLGHEHEIAQFQVSQVMTRRPIVMREQDLAVEAMRIMQDKRIFVLLVVDAQRRLTGILHFLDLLDAGVI